jgi:hypothetical protein
MRDIEKFSLTEGIIGTWLQYLENALVLAEFLN